MSKRHKLMRPRLNVENLDIFMDNRSLMTLQNMIDLARLVMMEKVSLTLKEVKGKET